MDKFFTTVGGSIDEIERKLWCDVCLRDSAEKADSDVKRYRKFFGVEPDTIPVNGKFTLDVEWPEWAEYAAMDEDEEWFFYSVIPCNVDGVWYMEGRGTAEGFKHKPFPGDWKDSLICKADCVVVGHE